MLEKLYLPSDESVRLPSLIIDPHVHGRGFKESHKTTPRQVMIEAKLGLINVSAFMPNTKDPITDLLMLTVMENVLTTNSHEILLPNQRIWFGVTDNNLSQCITALRHPLVCGLKVYPLAKDGKGVTTGTIGAAQDITILMAIKAGADVDKPTAFHCSDPAIFARDGRDSIDAEVSYVRKVIRIAKMVPGAKIIICHVSCKESAQMIIEAQRYGLDITIELSPHHLWFTSEGHNWNQDIDPIYYHCFNNLRPLADREFLRGLLARTDVKAYIGSDSAYHTQQEKLEKKMGGIPSNQEMVAVLCTLKKQYGISDQRMSELLCLNAARVLNIPLPEDFRLKEYNLELRKVTATYNNGVVLNPWQGTELLFSIEK